MFHVCKIHPVSLYVVCPELHIQFGMQAAGARRHVWAKWQTQAMEIRQDFGVAPHFKPWTKHEFEYKGLSKTPRIMETLDLAVISYLKGQNAAVLKDAEQASSCDRSAVQVACRELLTDVSQNPYRKAFTSQQQVAKCLTTSSLLYAHGRDRVVLPIEQFLFQGYSLNVQLPSGMKQRALKELSAEGMFLPSLGLVVQALKHSGSLEV